MPAPIGIPEMMRNRIIDPEAIRVYSIQYDEP